MQPVKRNIKHTRGDTYEFDFQVNDSVAQLVEAYFSIRVKEDDDEYVLQKRLNHGITPIEIPATQTEEAHIVYRVRLEAEDTADLTVRDYVYDVQLTLGTNVVTPLKGTFTLTGDVTRGAMA